jgi:predicted dinucleotide-binding enzyme
MKVGILGSGVVAQALAEGFIKYGHEVTLGTRNESKLADSVSANAGVKVGSFADAARSAEMVVLAVKGTAATNAIRGAGPENMAGKPVIDATNPIADAPPDNGVLKFFTDLDKSLMELLQDEFPDIHFVKAFNSVGSALMVDPQFKGGKPTMFICGNDEPAKKVVSGILEQFGWESEDMGAATAARAIEPLCILWCIPGFQKNEWNHAFKLLS